MASSIWPLCTITLLSVFFLNSCAKKELNISGVNMILIESGEFIMGDERGEWNEKPVSNVRITKDYYISDKAVSVKLFNEFLTATGKESLDKSSSVAVTHVSWYEANEFCKWLSEESGRNIRLPTEAEWEYAYKTSPCLIIEDSNTENWVLDNYGFYNDEAKSDPAGYKKGDLKVVRGGVVFSDSLKRIISYRLGSLPGDKNRKTGFRFVYTPLNEFSYVGEQFSFNEENEISDTVFEWDSTKYTGKPIFMEPVPFVKIPETGPLFKEHNHCPSIAWANNGDLLAAWYSTINEGGREHLVASSRLPAGTDNWHKASLFWDVPGRNDHATALFTLQDGTILHFNGFDVDTYWDELALFIRKSKDNGKTWSEPKIVMSDHSLRHMPIASVFEGHDGTLYLPCDAVTGGSGGTALLISKDGGETWVDHGEGKPAPSFKAGETGAWIAGIHAGVTEPAPGFLMALGRGDAINNKMPMSISQDGGKSWTYLPSPFEPISSGQRLVLRKLSDGSLFLFSFTKGMKFKGPAGRYTTGYGGFVALSTDNGKTWPYRRLLTDGVARELDGKAWTDTFTMDETHAEPKGYFTAVQTPDNLIHLISSGIHYRFNVEWIKEYGRSNPL